MKKPQMQKQLLVIGITLSFLLISSMSSFAINASNSFVPEKIQEDPVYFVYGNKGLNNWYITNVTVAFEYDTQRVKEIQYYLDNEWHVYTQSFTVSDDGLYFIEWFWVDLENKAFTGFPIQFKLDQTGPDIELGRKSGTKNKVIFTATTNDPTSEVDKVEFYFDDQLVDTLFESPYVWEWVGVSQHFVYAISYNYAGLSEKSETLGTRFRSSMNFLPFSIMLLHKLQFIVKLLNQDNY